MSPKVGNQYSWSTEDIVPNDSSDLLYWLFHPKEKKTSSRNLFAGFPWRFVDNPGFQGMIFTQSCFQWSLATYCILHVRPKTEITTEAVSWTCSMSRVVSLQVKGCSKHSIKINEHRMDPSCVSVTDVHHWNTSTQLCNEKLLKSSKHIIHITCCSICIPPGGCLAMLNQSHNYAIM